MADANLYPLRQSWEAGQVEVELKALAIDVYEQTILEAFLDLNRYGMAHLGSFALVERFVRADGLALVRGSDEDAMRYLYRAWRARNSGRGLHFLRTYLQLLWPNGWSLFQLWQDSAAVYPTDLAAVDDGVESVSGRFLTSRLQVGIEAATEGGSGVLRVIPALRSVVSAKFVMDVVLYRPVVAELGMVSTLVVSNVLILDLDCEP